MIALEIAREILGPEYSDDDLAFIIWEETGFPGFFDTSNGETKEEVFRRQLREFRDRFGVAVCP